MTVAQFMAGLAGALAAFLIAWNSTPPTGDA